ncbi:MAG: glycoside hydrolase family 32 protein [Lachnospiraceae bacterium]
MNHLLHLRAPGNWINDPNGFIYYKGMYHIFYQYFPYEPRWGTMHWGHAVSADLVHWQHLGVALFPTIYADQNGCFSGSAIEYDGKMYLYYTGVHYYRSNPEDIHLCLDDQFESAQLMITSEDGVHFANFHDKSVVIPPIENPEVGDRTHTRDPKVWRGTDAWYMVLGSSTQEKQGEIVIYKSCDLKDWSLAGTASTPEKLGWMWECPDYFEVNGTQVLIVSPMGIMKEPYTDQTVCTLVKFDEKSCQMQIPQQYQFLDYGLDLYAPQSTVDAEGRRVLVAWLRMPEVVNDTWRGMFCLPRVVEVQNGHIYFRVHPNVRAGFSRRVTSLDDTEQDIYQLRFIMNEGESIDIGGYRIIRREGRICTDRSRVFAGHEEYRMQAETPEIQDGNNFEVYVSEHLIEVFVNDGEYVLSSAVCGLRRKIVSQLQNEPQIYVWEGEYCGI